MDSEPAIFIVIFENKMGFGYKSHVFVIYKTQWVGVTF